MCAHVVGMYHRRRPNQSPRDGIVSTSIHTYIYFVHLYVTGRAGKPYLVVVGPGGIQGWATVARESWFLQPWRVLFLVRHTPHTLALLILHSIMALLHGQLSTLQVYKCTLSTHHCSGCQSESPPCPTDGGQNASSDCERILFGAAHAHHAGWKDWHP